MPTETAVPIVRTRQAAEAREARELAPYATRSLDAGPREREETEDAFRTPLQRDRDRILHSDSLRALQHKTQVFVVHEDESMRTRLTHTFEVAQIARALAGYLGANQDLAEAIALAHDLGHAPFGHAGEEELSLLLEEAGLPHFDHNHMSLRIVTELEPRAAKEPGLNLTFATREGIARHETVYDRPADVKRYYVSRQPGIEAQIANIADPLAYMTHDLEDALRLRFFDEDELRDLGLPLVDEGLKVAQRKASDVPVVERRVARARAIHRFLIDRLLTDLLHETEARLRAIGRGEAPTRADLREAESPVVAFSPGVGDQADRLRKFLHRRVYRHPTVLDMCTKGRRILRALFEHYIDRADHLPRKLVARLGVEKLTDRAARARALVDHLAGLTDRSAMDLYARLFDPFVRALPHLD